MIIDELDEEEGKVEAPGPQGRNKKPNTMVGSVKRGKYSR